MNIDLEKAKDEGFNLADIEILKNCEIKVDCSICKKGIKVTTLLKL